MPLIAPHGGKLVDRVLKPDAAAKAKAEAASLPAVQLSPREAGDLEMIAIGAFSPLSGFMGEADFQRVSKEMRLANGTVWPIPVILSPSDDVTAKINKGDRIALRQGDTILGTMTVTEKYKHDKAVEIPNVYRTEDEAHPGVKIVKQQGNWNLAGDIDVITPNPNPEFPEFRLPPAKTREAFTAKGWNTISAFQTRNPIHRSHEYLTKVALEMTDGLLIHPLVGETKADDIPAQTRMDCYQVLINNYYNPKTTMLSVMPLAMRYAGPREAVMHSLIRKNYGITHFIVGRDHAGVGNYYGTYDAQLIFEEFDPKLIDITPLMFEHAFYCRKCEAVVTAKTCPHGKDNWVFLSGTQVREMLARGEMLPREFTRPEVSKVLVEGMKRQRNSDAN